MQVRAKLQEEVRRRRYLERQLLSATETDGHYVFLIRKA